MAKSLTFRPHSSQVMSCHRPPRLARSAVLDPNCRTRPQKIPPTVSSVFIRVPCPLDNGLPAAGQTYTGNNPSRKRVVPENSRKSIGNPLPRQQGRRPHRQPPTSTGSGQAAAFRPDPVGPAHQIKSRRPPGGKRRLQDEARRKRRKEESLLGMFRSAHRRVLELEKASSERERGNHLLQRWRGLPGIPPSGASILCPRVQISYRFSPSAQCRELRIR